MWTSREEHPSEASLWFLLKGRYKDAFSDQSNSVFLPRESPSPVQSVAGSWQLIIKVTGFRDKKKNRSAFVYEAVNLQGVRVFLGVNSSLAGTTLCFLLEAVVEACLTAKHHGSTRVLLLSDSKGMVKIFNTRRVFDWQDHTRLADLNFLVQNGLLCHMILVSHVLVNYLRDVAKKATQMPTKLC